VHNFTEEDGWALQMKFKTQAVFNFTALQNLCTGLHSRSSPGLVQTSVKVHVAMLNGQALRQRHLLVIENAPVAALHDMRNVVATGGVCANVAHNGYELVLARSVQQLLHITDILLVTVLSTA
jgi:hypothetical protein